ncbi:uncharacterized protein LOC135392257 [Ornithodoros turicata]|uniref:uncharacterized protein LOC135392257 n=1 Tax=Ornithodoros turicata TaxID=34597 RepID=UPI0031391557
MDGNGTQPLVSPFVVRLPPFTRSCPDIWFRQAESQFTLAHITSQVTKFHHALSALPEDIPEDILIEVADIVNCPPADASYDALEIAVVERTSPSDRQCLQELVLNEPLGDRKPSQVLRQMQHLIGSSTFDPKLLRELFLSRLPPSVQLVLSASDDRDLPSLAARADNVTEIASGQASAHTLSAVNSTHLQSSPKACGTCTSSSASLENSEHIALRDEIERLADAFNRPSRRDSHSPGRAGQSRRIVRSPTPPSSSNHRPVCWYHRRFGRRARRCESPCRWQGNFTGDS